MSARESFAVVTAQIVGNLDNWQTVYYTDNERSWSRKNAIQRGWRNLGHDDFLLARLDGDHLLGVGWQYDPEHPDEDADAVAQQCGWSR